MILDSLTGKTATQRSALKADEIVKIESLEKTAREDYSIEIVGIEKINNGVSVLVKAWDSNGQIGFGKDGTVDIERFNIVNPPILVEDPLGTIQKSYIDPITDEEVTKNFREDPQEALLQCIEQTISEKKQRFSSKNIVRNKIGNTTTTVYPDANTETSTVDARVTEENNFPTGVSWATLKAGSGTAADDTSAATTAVQLRSGDTTDQWDRLDRGIFLFDTSGIGADQQVDSATFSFVAAGKGDSFSQSVSLTSSAPASNTAVVAGDWDSLGSTKYASDITIASITADDSTYNVMTLNAAGEAAISLTGITKFGTLASGDIDNSPPTWSASTQSFVTMRFADNTGTTKDPKLVVEHSDAPLNYTLTAAAGAFTLTGVAATLKVGYGIIASVGSFTLTGVNAAFTKTLSITAAVGSFTFTGVAATLGVGRKIIASVGSFVLTGVDVALSTTAWIFGTKPSAGSWTNTTKPSDSGWTNTTKPSDNGWTNNTKT